MASVAVWFGVLAVSLFVLLKASSFFTDAAEKIGVFLGIPSFIVGVTIVAFGTSLPEIISSVLAVLRGSSEIVAGNVVGSNIANLFLVLGLSAIVAGRLTLVYEIVHVDLPLVVGSAFFLAVTAWDGFFSVPEALLSLAGMVVYLHYAATYKRTAPDGHLKRERPGLLTWATPVLSGVFIYLGAKHTVDAVIRLAEMLHTGTEVIALSAVALGTSLPELAVSFSAVRNGNPELAVGNVLGSNVFNAFAVMGIPALMGGLVVPESILAFGLPVMLVGTLLCFFMIQEKEFTKWEGWLFVIFYIFFIGKTLGLI